MDGMGGQTFFRRQLPALFLCLIFGVGGGLPHGHFEAGLLPSTARHGQAELRLPEPSVVAESTACSACILQRLLAQARTAAVSVLEKPGATHAVSPVSDPAIVETFTYSGEPRSPPPSA